MDDSTLQLMLFGSLLLGAMGVIGFIWALRSGQFDDEKKLTHGLLFDGEDEYKEAVERERRLKEAAEAEKKTSEETTQK